jgi:hypothetical protein
MRRNGWKVGVAPKPPRRDFMTAAGEVKSVPQGVAPGFGYNPGTAHLQVLADRMTASIQQALASGLDDAAAAALRQIIADPAFEQFAALPQSAFPVAILTPDQQQLVGASARLVVMPSGVYQKQIGALPDISPGHPELTLDDYRLLPDIIDQAVLIAADGARKLVYFADAAGRLWKAVIRQDSGDGLPVLVSFHGSTPSKATRETRGLAIVLDRRQ